MPLINAGNHHLSLALPELPLMLHLDRHRIAQVLSNLVNNAAKYTPPGGHIEVAARCEGGEIVLSVSDDGIGIPPAMLPVIFDLYAQVHDAAGMAQGGLGVGLNLVKRLVELHGGRVRAESAGPQQGSRFTVLLPLDALQVPDGAPPAQAAAVAHPAMPGLNILIVDDNVDAAQTLGDLLELGGHSVAVVHSGAAGLAQAARLPPDVVFLDIGLPDQSGFDVAPAMRRIDKMAHATLVALTGWGAAEDRMRSSAAGFDAHLTKPANLEHVEAVLQQAAQRRHAILTGPAARSS